MKRLIAGLVVVASLAAADLSPDEYLGYVKFLAADNMRGRATGSPELEKAADFIAARFKAFGLKPVEGDSYFQSFEVTTSARLGSKNNLAAVSGGKRTRLKFQRDFVPLNLSTKGKVSGGVVFAGYGITAPEYNYDDYAGLDVKDKIVLILRHEPQEFDEKSVFDGKVYTAHAQIFAKAANAKMHGARAILMVNDVAAHPSDPDQLEKFGETSGPGNAGIAFVQVKAEVANQWLEASGKSLEKLQAEIDKTVKPASFALPASVALEMNVDVERESKTVHNVAGYLPGETGEYVILGAHYDHLGLGEQFTLAPSLVGTVHPGADDNASGTAGVLELAHWFQGQPKHKRGILFLAFAGEELGLLGSSYYANHPDLPLGKAVTMINLDMIGRLRDKKVYVGGTGTGSTLAELLKAASARHEVQTDLADKAGYGSSDHMSFTMKQMPDRKSTRLNSSHW